MAPAKKLLTIIGAIVGSYLGWLIGDHVGVMSAFLMSTVGAGVGVYLGRLLAVRLTM